METLLSTVKWSAAIGAASLILTLLKPLLDKRYSAKWRYGAWLALAVLLLLAPVRWDALLPRAPAPLVIEVPEAAVAAGRLGGLTVSPSGAVLTPEGSAPLPLEPVLTGLWLTGGALVLLYHLAGTWRFTRRALRWSLPAGKETQGIYREICREMGLKKPPLLCRSAAVDSPMATGLFRTRLLLPEEEIGPRELAFILRHELTHYRRHDLWYKLVLLLANALHWFNPLIWLLRRESERDLELTCDDAVVAGADAETRRAYSETLLASIRRQRQKAFLSTHFYGGNSAMKERFRNILGKRGQKRGAAVLAAVLAATVAAGSAFALEAAAPEEPSPPAGTAAVPDRPEGPENPPAGTVSDTPPVPDASHEEPAGDAAPAPSSGAAAPLGAPSPKEESGSGVPPAPEEPAFDFFAETPTRVVGDFDGDGKPDPVFLERYHIVDDPVTKLRFFVPNDPASGDHAWVAEIDEASGKAYSLYDSDALGIPIAAGVGLPEPYTPTRGTIGDFDRDGLRDTEVEINGRVYPLIWDEGDYEPLPGIDGVFSASGDYDGDGQPDSEVQINGQRYRITANPDGSVTYTEQNPG